MKRMQRGFTLLELMIMVAIIGILAAIGLFAYQDFVIRARVSELVLVASGYTTSISEKADVEMSIGTSGVGLTVIVAGKVSGGSITDDGIVTVSGDATTVGTAVTIVLTPTLIVENRQVTWVCTGTPKKFVPANCR